MMHKTVSLVTPSGDHVDIDQKLADLVTQIWKAGIRTVSSCEDAAAGPLSLSAGRPYVQAMAVHAAGYAYVDFDDTDAAALLYDAVANAGPRDDFYVRMVHWFAPNAWRIHLHLTDYGTDGEDEATAPSQFEPGLVQVSFPASDIPEITRRLARHNAGHPPVLGEIDWRSVEINGDDDS